MLALNGFVVFAEGLDAFRLRAVANGSKRLPSGNITFPNKFRLMDVWGLNPERLEPHLTKASVTEGAAWGLILPKGIHDWGKQAMFLKKSTPACALQLREKKAKNLSQC